MICNLINKNYKRIIIASRYEFIFVRALFFKGPVEAGPACKRALDLPKKCADLNQTLTRIKQNGQY